MEIKQKNLNELLESFKTIYYRGGVESAEIEYHLSLIFDKNSIIINKILEQWERERDQ